MTIPHNGVDRGTHRVGLCQRVDDDAAGDAPGHQHEDADRHEGDPARTHRLAAPAARQVNREPEQGQSEGRKR